MQTQKMSLANIKGKLSRTEMKNIMAGSDKPSGRCCLNGSCSECYTGLTCANGAVFHLC